MALASSPYKIWKITTSAPNQDVLGATSTVGTAIRALYPNFDNEGMAAQIILISDNDYTGTVEINDNGEQYNFVEDLVYDTGKYCMIKSVVLSGGFSGTILIGVL